MAVQTNVLVLDPTTRERRIHQSTDTNPVGISGAALDQTTDPGANSGFTTVWADSSDDLHSRRNSGDVTLTQSSGTEINYAIVPIGAGLTNSGTDIVVDFGTTNLTTVNAGDSASYGTNTDAARTDHEHAVSTAIAGGISGSAAEGVATSLARSDHDHSIDADTIDDTHIDWGTSGNKVSAVDVPLADALTIWTTDNVEAAFDQIGGKYLAQMTGSTGYTPVNAQNWDEVNTEIQSAASTATARTSFTAGKGVFVDASGAYGSPTPTLPSPVQVTSIGSDGAVKIRDSSGDEVDDGSGNEVYAVLYWNTSDSKFYFAFFSDVAGTQTAYTITGSPTNWDFYFPEIFYLIDIPATSIIRGGLGNVASSTGDITGVTAGNGLTGGGTSGTVTLTVGSGTGITVNVSDVAIDQSANLTSITGDWNFAGGTLGLPTGASTTEGDIWYVTASDKLAFYKAAAVATVWDDTALAVSSAQYSLLVADAAAGWAEDTGFKVTSGAVTTGSWTATAIGPTYGGTGQTTVTAGDILYGSAANVWSKLPKGSDGDILKLASGLPSWASVATVPASTAQYSILVADAAASWVEDTAFKVTSGAVTTGSWTATAVGAQYGGTGIATHAATGVPYVSSGSWATETLLDETRGGTGIGSYTGGDLIHASGASSLQVLNIGNYGYMLMAGGAGSFPSWQRQNGLITEYDAGTGGVTNNRFVALENATDIIHATKASAGGAMCCGIALNTATVGNPAYIATIGKFTVTVVGTAGAIAVNDVLYLDTAGQVTTASDITLGTDWVVPVAIAAAALSSGGGSVAALIGPLPGLIGIAP